MILAISPITSVIYPRQRCFSGQQQLGETNTVD
jgi:hypothetical protein